jgi:dTDP-4-amino-4,6-dideoxygalactose transaminase
MSPEKRARCGAASLAVFGAAPLFERPRTTAQLANRDPERFFTLAAGIFERRWLSNQGPLVCELEERISELHGVRHCVTFANGCFALALALHSLARPGARKVVLPSLSFRGLPHVIQLAGLKPEFCDVDPATHTVDSASLAARLDDDTAAALAVDNVSALRDIDALEQVTRRAGVALVLDTVYGVGSSYGQGAVGSRGNVSSSACTPAS